METRKEDIIQYAHYGYVHCMLLATGLLQDDSGKEILISGGGDGTIKLWGATANTKVPLKELHTLENGDNSVLTMAMEGMFLYAGKLDGEIDVWDLDTRQLIRTVKAYNADVLSISVSNGLIFTGGADGVAKIFERYKCQNQWKAHENLILATTVVIGQDRPPIFVTGGNDDCIAIWSIADSIKAPASSKPSDEQLVESLRKFVTHRSVSSSTNYAEDCRKAASWLRGLFKKFGASTEMLKTEDSWNPIVLATFKGRSSNGKRVLFYGHYDVVAAENEQQKWLADPFDMQGRDGYLYGRGVSDNKGPILAALYAVADLVSEQKLATDVVFLIEGEEECGSRGFEDAIRRNKHIIGDIDWILLANSYWLNDDFPCLTYGLRGVVHATVTVGSNQKDLHSGVNGSHLTDESLKDMVMLLAKWTGSAGSINIPGFYNNILPITKGENAHYEVISRTLEGIDADTNEYSTAKLQARWREPSLTVHGIKTSGPANQTVIPATATATLSLRLVPNQDAQAIEQSLVSFLEEEFASLDTSNTLSITTGHPSDPWLGDPDNKIFQTLEKAIIEVWGLGETNSSNSPDTRHKSKSVSEHTSKLSLSPARAPKHTTTLSKPLYIREGGSIPAIRFLEKEFNAPAAQLPCGQASDNAHLDNERLRLSNLYNSRRIFMKLFRDLPAK
jgi:di- and tripeptidase